MSASKTSRLRRTARTRRHLRVRKKVSGTTGRPRLVVTRSTRHIYVQVVDDTVSHTLVAASTLDDGIRGTAGELDAFNEPRHEDRAAIEVRYRIVDRQALRGIVVPLQESQDRGVALNPGTRPSGGKRAGDPGATVIAVDAEHVGLVHAELRRRSRVNAVAIPEMNQ